MRSAVLCVLATGCNLYFGSGSGSQGGGVTVDALVYPRDCIRSIATGNNLPGRPTIVVGSGCNGSDTVESLQVWNGALDQLASRTVLGMTYRGFQFGNIADTPGIETIGIANGTSGSYVEWGPGATTVPQTATFTGAIADLSVADVDGDGRDDVVVAKGVDIIAGLNRPGALPSSADERVLLSGRQFFAAKLAPLPDGSPGLYYIALGQGANETGVAHRVSANPPVYSIDRFVTLPVGREMPGGAVQPLVVADVDGDGKPDVIGAAQRVFVWSSRTGNVGLLDDEALGIGVGDVDGDGLAEPVYLTTDKKHVRKVIVATDGALGSEPLLNAGGDGLAVGDFDGDNVADIATFDKLGVRGSRVLVYRL